MQKLSVSCTTEIPRLRPTLPRLFLFHTTLLDSLAFPLSSFLSSSRRSPRLSISTPKPHVSSFSSSSNLTSYSSSFCFFFLLFLLPFVCSSSPLTDSHNCHLPISTRSLLHFHRTASRTKLNPHALRESPALALPVYRAYTNPQSPLLRLALPLSLLHDTSHASFPRPALSATVRNPSSRTATYTRDHSLLVEHKTMLLNPTERFSFSPT